MIDGKTITLAGTDYTLPALPIGKISLLPKLFHNPLENEEVGGALIESIFYSLRRNYPNIEKHTVEDGIDLINFGAVLAAFTEVNQLERTTPGEARAVAST
jgi:hypothetical protein